MRDFLYTFGLFTAVGIFLAAFVRFVFFLSMYGYTAKFLSIVLLFMGIGVIAGIIAGRYKLITRAIDSIWF